MHDGLERKPGGSGVAHVNVETAAGSAPGKRTLTEQLGAPAIQRSEAPVPASGQPAAGAADQSAARPWKVPSAAVVSGWLSHWAGLWTTIAGEAFDKFSTAVQTDSHKSSNVGALIAMAGDALWVLGGLVPDPPVEILGASLSAIGAFIPAGNPPKQDLQILALMQKGLDKFSSDLNNGVDVRSRWDFILDKPEFKTAGSDPKAHDVIRKLTHIPDTDNQGQLRHGIELKLIDRYLHLKKAYIEHKIDYTLGGPVTEDSLKNVSGDVASAFGGEMGINPLPRDREGHRTANPFKLAVKDKIGFIT